MKLVGGHRSLLALLDVERANRKPAGAAGDARAAEDRNGVAGVGEADLPAEEQLHVRWRVLPAGRRRTRAAGAAVPVAGRPNWKMPEFSRKKSRFSGKSRLKRVRLTCCSSASTCEKSVLP